MKDEYEKGSAESHAYYVVDKKTRKLIKKYLPADAVIPEARPGTKAGNSLLNHINKELQNSEIVKLMKKLHELDKLLLKK